MVNIAQDHDTNLALAWAVLLQKDVANLSEERSDAIKDLLAMQQVQVSIAVLLFFNLALLVLDVFLLCFCFAEPSESCGHLGSHEGAIDQEENQEEGGQLRMILPRFSEEEYMNHLIEEDGKGAPKNVVS